MAESVLWIKENDFRLVSGRGVNTEKALLDSRFIEVEVVVTV